MSSYEGRLGRHTFLINALDAQAAVALALLAAGDHGFRLERSLSEDDPRVADLRESHDMDRQTQGSGAWSIEITRIGHPVPGHGEFDADYLLTSLTLDRPFPHERPHAEDEPGHWAAARVAARETIDLSACCAPPSASPRARRPSL